MNLNLQNLVPKNQTRNRKRNNQNIDMRYYIVNSNKINNISKLFPYNYCLQIAVISSIRAMLKRSVCDFVV